MNSDTLYFLEISGLISTSKHREFQQTVKFIFNHLSSGCLKHNLALDVETPNLYHFYSLWRSQEALIAFKSSHEYDLLKGAFQTLGDYHTLSGKYPDIHLFELNNMTPQL